MWVLPKRMNSTNIYLAFTTHKSISNLMDKYMKENYVSLYKKNYDSGRKSWDLKSIRYVVNADLTLFLSDWNFNYWDAFRHAANIQVLTMYQALHRALKKNW